MFIVAEKAKARVGLVEERCRRYDWLRANAGVAQHEASHTLGEAGEGGVEGEGCGEEAGMSGSGRVCVHTRRDGTAVNIKFDDRPLIHTYIDYLSYGVSCFHALPSCFHTRWWGPCASVQSVLITSVA